tara:strand:+ start:1583 stop:2167 length:585 start_codon:yes stop_codon:yes gene_type:complete
MSEPNALHLICFLIALNPSASILGVRHSKFRRNLLKVCKPFDHSSIKSSFEIFIEKVPPNEKILLIFSDPNNSYEKLFDGYRVLIELPMFVCSENDILLFPNFYAIENQNCPNPLFWGKEKKTIIKNMKFHSCKYFILITDDEKKENLIEDDLFDNIATFDWQKNAPDLYYDTLWKKDKPLPKFHLIKLIEKDS